MPFPLAYSTLHWKDADLEDNLGLLAAAGYRGWEARQSIDWLGTPQRLRQVCRRAGVDIAAVCGPNVSLDPQTPAQSINKRRIEYAAELEVPLFMTKGPGRLDRTTTDADLDRMAALYEDLARHAAPLGVTVTFHPHINHLVDSADEWYRFMQRLDTCRLCLDMSHAVHWGLDPLQAVADFAERIAYVHLHDFKDGEWLELGSGPMCDYKAFLQALEGVEYSGWVTVCPGGAPRPEADKMAINRTYLRGLGY